jgi:cytochrome c556
MIRLCCREVLARRHAEKKGPTMKQHFAKFALLACSFLALAACGQQSGGGKGAAAEDTPEQQAFEFRDGLMHAISWKVGRLRGMAQGDIPADDAVALKDARDVATLAGMITEGFIPNSIVKSSLATPEIWMNFADFQQKAGDLQMAATALADAAQANGFAAAKGMVQAVGQSCGGCHRPYRKRQEQ